MTKARGKAADDIEPTVKVRPIRVLLADDHPPILEGLTSALEREGIAVVAVATTPQDVLAKYMESTPDVIVLDIRYGRDGNTGLDVAREALARYPHARIVVYTQFDADELVREAYRLGCLGFVTKGEATSTLARAIKAANAGKTFFLPEIGERMALIGVHGDTSPLGRLEPREFQVFRFMAQGHTAPEIGAGMNLSVRTISVISQAVKDKLGVSRQAELTLLAVRYHVLEP